VKAIGSARVFTARDPRERMTSRAFVDVRRCTRPVIDIAVEFDALGESR
jgi:hypothetical protein